MYASALSARRRFLTGALFGALLPATAARAGFNFFTSEYTATRDELQTQIARRFPVQQRVAELFAVDLRDPRLELDARSNRAAITAALSVASPFLQPGRIDGSITVGSALRYDPAALALRLDRPRTERLDLQGLAGREYEQLRQIAAVAMQELLRDYPLHTFRPDDLTVGRKTYAIGDITVLADGIKVQLL